MGNAIKRWLKDWLGISIIERENLQLAKTLVAQTKRIDEQNERIESLQEWEVRISFLEKCLTAKATTAKIVPKPHKVTTRQFLEAASKATEDKEESNG